VKGPVRPSRHTERSEITRARLIKSAEKIFARDGFEAAKLEEIAAEAGYTRGAFYANFAGKEDLFLALLEREISSRIQNVQKQMDKVQDAEAKLQALRNFLLDVCLDRRWSLLALEFKLFAVRHPEARARLAEMNRRFESSRVRILEGIVKALGRELPASANAVGISLSALTNTLTLEHMLDRAAMPEEDVKKIMQNFFDGLTGEPRGKVARKRKSRLPDA